MYALSLRNSHFAFRRLYISPKCCRYAHCTLLQSVNCNRCLQIPSPLHVQLVCSRKCSNLNPELLDPFCLHSQSRRKESAVSSLIHVIHIQLFHKLAVAVMSALFIQVSAARKQHRGFFFTQLTALASLLQF